MGNNALLSPGQITLIVGNSAFTRQRMNTQVVAAALIKPVKLLIGGGRYDHYGINYAAAAAAPDYERVLREHIFLSRAETCYQMVELLGSLRADLTPVFVFDLLESFGNDVTDRELNQLVFEAKQQIRRVSQFAPVIISVRQQNERQHLISPFMQLAHQVITPLKAVSEPALQYRLPE